MSISWGWRTGMAGVVWMGLVLMGLPAAAELPRFESFEAGDVAPMDLVAPAPFMVFNAEKTAWRRDLEMRRVPLCFRYCPDTEMDVEARLREAVGRTRSQFLKALESRFQSRVVTEETVGTRRFERFMSQFQRNHAAFPLTPLLAADWALGRPDDAQVELWTERLRGAMGHLVRADGLPGDLPWGTLKAFLFTRARALPSPALDELAGLGQLEWRTNLLALSRARREFRASFQEEERGLGQFLSGFLRENCVFEEALTRERRLERGRAVWVADRYELGQVLVRRGQVLDEASARMLNEGLASQLTLKRVESETVSAVIAAVETPGVPGGEPGVRWWLWGAGLVLAGGGLALGWWRWAGRVANSGDQTVTLHAKDTINVVTCPSCLNMVQVPDEVEPCRERARAAELRARTAATLLREQLLPAFAHWMRSRTVRAFVGQRDDMRRQQELAEEEICKLAKRLAAMHAPLRERLIAYEARIAELEKQLAAKGEENKELLKAQLEALRKRLIQEQKQSPTNWN